MLSIRWVKTANSRLIPVWAPTAPPRITPPLAATVLEPQAAAKRKLRHAF